MKRKIPSQSFFLSLLPVVAANAFISMVISLPLFQYGNRQGNLPTLAANLISFVSHYFLLNLAAGIIISLLSFIPYRRLALSLKIALFSILQVSLLIDTKIYSLFQYHFNSLVWNVITTEGVTDSVMLGTGTVLDFIFRVVFILFAEVIINIKLAGLYKSAAPVKLSFFIRASRILFCASLCLILLDKGIYAYGDIFNKTDIIKNVKLYPLYQPLTIKRFASKVLHIKLEREVEFKVSTAGTSLNYPKQPPKFDPAGNKNYNIVIIILDGLRFDMLDKEITPNAWAFGRNNVIYANHYSGGNGTRFGMFSLLYGIHGTYWHTFLAQRRSPVLIDSLIGKGYDFTILSSTLLTFPEFRKTAFIRIPQQIKDNFQADNIAGRDELAADEFTGYISARKTQKPFFAFLYFNSSHQPYMYPGGFMKFRPAGDREINYFKGMGKGEIDMLRNQYKNAVYYEDHLLGRIIGSLEKNRLLDRTIVVITGDHGEEFYENNYFGHTSSFDDYQLKTAFILHYPGFKPREIRRITSHLDLVPTLMESLGCTSPPGDYSQGFSLLSEKRHTYITAANWDKAAIFDDEIKIVYSTELYNMKSFEVRRKTDYALIADPRQILKQKNALLLDALQKMSEFYKKM